LIVRNPAEPRRFNRVNNGRPKKSATLLELRKLASLASDVALALTRSSDLRTSLQRCAEALVRGLDAAFARIWTLNDNDNVLELEASAGLYTHLNGSHSRVPVGQLKIGLIAQEGKPHFTNTVLGDPRVNDQEWARREGMIAFAGHPLICANRVVGVMALFSRRPLTHRVCRALAMVADSIAHRIAHGRSIEALRLSEERFALAVQGTDEGIWDWNIATGDVYMAPRFKELLGYAEHELESHFATFESRLHPEDRERILQALGDHLERRRPYRVEFRLRAKTGEFRWFHATRPAGRCGRRRPGCRPANRGTARPRSPTAQGDPGHEQQPGERVCAEHDFGVTGQDLAKESARSECRIGRYRLMIDRLAFQTVGEQQ
jgi:PAS domain S-box-containing protein